MGEHVCEICGQKLIPEQWLNYTYAWFCGNYACAEFLKSVDIREVWVGFSQRKLYGRKDVHLIRSDLDSETEAHVHLESVR